MAEDVAQTLLERLSQVGLVDDAEYADTLVRTRHNERNLGRRALAQELRRKGVDEETAARALDQIDDEDESAAALAVARARLRATRGADHQVRYRRTVAALGRRGFSGDTARQALRAALAEEELDPDVVGGPDGD